MGGAEIFQQPCYCYQHLEVSVDSEEIEANINELNRLIGFISCVSEEGNEEFLDLTDDLPDPVHFNNNEDE